MGTSATNVLWLSADRDVFSDAGTTAASNGNNVQQWNDRSGNGRNASQATLANRPGYITGIINSLPVLSFNNGNDDNLIATNVATANVASIWAVASYSTLPDPNPGILLGSPAGTGANAGVNDKCIGMWVSNAAGTQVWGRGIQSNNTTRNISQVTTLNASTFYIINNMYRSNAINQYVNNAAAGDNTGHDGTLKSWRDITIGRQGTESWNGNIAEVIFYNIEINSAQRIIIDNYLAAKYGLTLATNDVYDEDNSGFDFEVAGIGRVDASNIHNDAQGSGMVRILNPSGLGNNEFLMWGHNNGTAQATNTTDVPVGVAARFDRVWRVSEVSTSLAAVDVGSIDMRFDLSGLGSITASDLRLLVDTDNDGNFADETPISGASLVGGSVYQFTGVTAISNNRRFTIATINKGQTPLPVELVDFFLRNTGENNIELRWTTAAEINNKHFELNRSLDGEHWEELATIKGKTYSLGFTEYSFIDEHPYPNLSYYRIRQMDLDGTYKDFPMKSIYLDVSEPELSIFPNPAFTQVFVQGAAGELATVEIFNLLGKSESVNIRRISQYKIELDLSNLQSGVYLLKTNSSRRKIVKSE